MPTISISNGDDYEKMENEMDDSFKNAAKNTDSKILKEYVDEMGRKDDPEIQRICRMIHMLVDEGLEMYREGDIDLDEMIEDLYKALKAIE